jgi:hypothetical protein
MTAFPDAIQDETIETAPPPPNEERDTYEELIEITLTPEDIVAKHEKLEHVDRELVRLDTEKKAAAKVFTNQIKPLQAERESILDALAAGTEKRHVEVYDHFVIDPGSQEIINVEIRRVDSDAKVDERAATAEERRDQFASLQGDLFDGGGSQPPPADIYDPADPVTAEDFEPTPEALAQAAEDEGRVVKTSSKEAKAKKAKRQQAEQDAE